MLRRLAQVGIVPVVALLLAALALVVVEAGRRPPAELPSLAPPPTGYDPGLAGFAVRAGELDVPYRVFGLFVRPGEAVPLAVASPGARVEAEAAGGALARVGPGRWRWTAPAAPGLYPLRFSD